MNSPLCDETLLQTLPVPLAQLYRRAHNAKTALERHLTAYYLWEAGLKLLGSAAVVAYVELGEHDPAITDRLAKLSRPGLGDWWGFVRRLVPVLADKGDEGFGRVREVLLGRTRDDMPRAAGLDAALREALEGKSGARNTVYLAEVFDRLVRYRNSEVGHGAAGQQSAEFYDRMGKALLAGIAEIFRRLDVLAGRRLIYVAEVRQVAGQWLVQRYELSGESPRRIESLELPRGETANLPDAERLYLQPLEEGSTGDRSTGEMAWRSLHPLAIHDAEAGEVLFLNARRGRRRAEYLCYTTGRRLDRQDLGGEQRALLSRLLGIEVGDAQVEQWAAQSQAEEGPLPETPLSERRTLGEFELWSELGRGGMGIVYRAWQPSLGRQVAVKKLQRTGDPKAEARFAREIHALGKVDHPHLVKIFTSGSDADQWFYAMELVEGAPLSAVCDRLATSAVSVTEVDLPRWRQTLSQACEDARNSEKPLSTDVGAGFQPAQQDEKDRAGSKPAPTNSDQQPRGGKGYIRQVVELMRQVAEAAHALHERGIIHRDIKPGNILVGAAGDRATLMDLGLAQLADDVAGKLTRTRQFVGTLRYASPEQVLAAGRLDRRSDVYSLGATLWELLTLRPLFGATDQTPTPQLMMSIQHDEPQRLRTVHPQTGRDLEAVVHKCLEKSPDRRYASARELAEELRRVMEGEPVQARAVGRLDRAVKWVKRHPASAVALALSVIVVVLLTVAGVVAWLWHDSTHAREAAEAARQAEAGARWREAQARGQAERALVILKEQADELGALYDIQKEHLGEEARLRKKAELAEQAAKQAQEGELRAFNLLARFKHATDMSLAFHELSNRNAERARTLVSSAPAHLRGWEWSFLHERCKREPSSKDLGWCFGASPDGRYVACPSGHDRDIQIRDVSTTQLLFTLQGDTRFINKVSFCSDGRHIAACASQGSVVTIWDLTNGKLRSRLGGHKLPVTAFDFAPDGRHIAVSSEDGKTKIWEFENGTEKLSIDGHRDARSLTFSPNGRFLASTGVLDTLTVKVWNLAGGKEVLSAATSTRPRFSSDSRLIALGSPEGSVSVWDLNTAKVGHTLTTGVKRIEAVSFSPDGRWLAATAGKVAKIWDLRNTQKPTFLEGHKDKILDVAFSPDGRLLATSSWDTTVKIWQLTGPKEIFLLDAYGIAGARGVTSATFVADGRHLLTFGKGAKLWDLSAGGRVLALQGKKSAPSCTHFSNDGRRLTTSGFTDDGVSLSTWDLPTATVISSAEFKGKVTRLALSPDGRFLATGLPNNTVIIRDLGTGKPIRTLGVPAKDDRISISALSFSPDAAKLAVGSYDMTLKVWDVATGAELFALKGHKGRVRSLAFSPDGLRLAAGCHDGLLRGEYVQGSITDYAVRVWDLSNREIVATLPGHRAGIISLSFSPDGRLLASGSSDYTARVWDVATKSNVFLLEGHKEFVSSLCFSVDGRILASSSGDDLVKLWDMIVGKEVLTLEAGLGQIAFSADGKRLAGGFLNGRTLVWEASPIRQLWHLRQASECEWEENWFAAAFHLEKQIAEEQAYLALEKTAVLMGPQPVTSLSQMSASRNLEGRTHLADLQARHARALEEWKKTK